MQASSWLLVAIAALAASCPSVDAMRGASAVSLASTSQCSSVDTCYKGGSSSTACTVSSGGCPPCVTFADDGCYVKVDGACPFGVDCASVWGGSTTSSGSSASSTTTSSSSGTSTGSTTTTTSSTTSSTTGTTAGTSSKSASGTSGTAGVSSSSTASSTSGSSGTSAGGSDMSVVFAIIGAAIGVIAVAVIFLTLVRRSKAAREEEEDDMANTPPAFSKNPVVQAPHSTTGAAMYSSYGGSNRAPGMGSGGAGEIGLDVSKGVSMNAVSYYNQQPPQNATAPSPRVAGRAIPSQPVGMNQSARAYGSQNYGQMGASGVNPMAVSGGNAMGTSGASQAPPTPVQHLPMGGVAPSPHTRRESYEF